MQSASRASFVTMDRQEILRWDEEWVQYLRTQPLEPHLLDGRAMTVAGDVAGKPPEEVYGTIIGIPPPGSGGATAAGVWVPGDVLKGGKLLELGCGTGVLGKQLGLICDEYLGVDLSRVPLGLAHERAPENCTFLHIHDHDALEPLAGRYDAVIGREFFAHQNYYASLDMLRFARAMLRPGGRVYADFFMVVWGVPVGVIYPARSDVDLVNVSCGYYYVEEDVRNLAQASGMRLVEQTPQEPLMRRFAVFEKPASGAPEL